MNFHNTSQPYMRPVIQVGVGQRSMPQKKRGFPTSMIFWRPVGKILLTLLLLVLAINLYITYSLSKVSEATIAADNKRHELMDKNIELRATKARLRAEEQLQQLAAEKLSLHVHTKGQVGIFDHRKGYFIYL